MLSYCTALSLLLSNIWAHMQNKNLALLVTNYWPWAERMHWTNQKPLRWHILQSMEVVP